MAKKNMMKHYEYTYLTRQDMDEAGAKNLSDKLTELIQAKQGVVGDLPRAYKKRLAYRIKRQDVAYVNTILFQTEPAAVVELKRETDKIEEIIRGLFISYDPEKLKREPRRERPARQTAVEIDSTEKAPTFKTEQKISTEAENEKPKEENKEEVKEEKENKKSNEKKQKEEAKESKPAKPKRTKKAKAELRDIGEKLDEILK